jgi:hypothetical protein
MPLSTSGRLDEVYAKVMAYQKKMRENAGERSQYGPSAVPACLHGLPERDKLSGFHL